MVGYAFGHPQGSPLIAAGHIQKVTHTYFVAYPDHEPRAGDPHYVDFHHWREKTKATARCSIGEHRDDYSECFPPQKYWPIGLECHHSIIEFALMNAVDLAWLEKDFPGISDPNSLGAWIESPANLIWLCVWHHRGLGGVHKIDASNYEGERYVKGLIVK